MAKQKIQVIFTISIIIFNFIFGISQSIDVGASKLKSTTKISTFSQKVENKLKSIFQEKALFGDFIFAIVDENGLVYSVAVNRNILEGKSSSLNNDSPLYIASATKSFTATLLKKLEEEKSIDLNKSLHDYLPQLNFKDSIDTKKITIKNLLNHTHGTFSTKMTWKTAFLGYGGKNEELINDMNGDFMHDASGKFRYSNIGPILAGMVVESAIGKSWKTALKEQVFIPLNMKNTSTYVSDFDSESILPAIRGTSQKGIIEKGFYKKDITMHAAGGIISTINDLSKWLKANISEDKTLLSNDSWNELHNSTTLQNKDYFSYHRTGYSLGWDIAEYQGEKILTRFGGLEGISFHISFMPEKKMGVIAFSNDNRAYLLPHLMANYAYNIINDLPADSIFEVERTKFEQSFADENEKEYPSDAQLVKDLSIHDDMIGIYNNDADWPTISINKTDHYYTFQWGVLSGKIYENTDGTFFSDLGMLSRDFKIEKDTLVSGSLIYTKVEKQN